MTEKNNILSTLARIIILILFFKHQEEVECNGGFAYYGTNL